MKPLLHTFLTVSTFFCVFYSQNVYSQTLQDSLSYYSDKALSPQNATDLNKSYNYFKAVYDLAVTDKQLVKAVNALYYQASIEYKKGNYDTAESTSVSALKLLKDIKNSEVYVASVKKSFYNLLGLMFVEQRNITKAIEVYNEALKHAITTSDSIKIYNNTSLIYKEFYDTKNEKLELLKAYQLLPKIKDKLTVAMVLDNLGFVKTQLNEPDGVLLLNTALQLRENANDSATLYTSYSHLAEYYHGINSMDSCSKYAMKAYKLASKINSVAYKSDALGLLTSISNDDYAKAYKKLNDSLYHVEKESINKFALIKYDNSLYKEAALESQLREEKERVMKIIYLSAIILILIIGVFLYFFIKIRHKKDRLQQIYNTESDISKKVHDEVANDIYQLMVKLQKEKNLDQSLKNDAEKIYGRARDISKELRENDVEGDFNIILNDLIFGFNDNFTNVIVRGISKVNWEEVSNIKKVTLHKVLQELLINMKKHSKASIAVISFDLNKKKIRINYTDDGVGCDLKQHTGLDNVENRIKIIKGTVTFTSEIENGFKAEITI